jgi:hypothetical protein
VLPDQLQVCNRQVTPNTLHGMAGSAVAKLLPWLWMVLALGVNAGDQRSR